MENQLKQQEITSTKISKDSESAVALFKQLKLDSYEISDLITKPESHPVIQTMKRELGFPLVKMVMVMLLEDLVRSLNIKEPSKEQVLEIATELLNDNPLLTIEDFKIFFTNYKKGTYGIDYHRFDIPTIYLAFSQYKDERAEIHENILEQRKNELNADPAIRTNDLKKVGEILYNARQKAEKEKQREKLIEEKKPEWTAQAVKEWEENKRLWIEFEISEQDAEVTKRELEIYYAQNYPKGDYIKWYINQKILTLK